MRSLVFRYAITAESHGERILKIGQHLPKLWQESSGLFFTRGVVKKIRLSFWGHGAETSDIDRSAQQLPVSRFNLRDDACPFARQRWGLPHELAHCVYPGWGQLISVALCAALDDGACMSIIMLRYRPLERTRRLRLLAGPDEWSERSVCIRRYGFDSPVLVCTTRHAQYSRDRSCSCYHYLIIARKHGALHFIPISRGNIIIMWFFSYI